MPIIGPEGQRFDDFEDCVSTLLENDDNDVDDREAAEKICGKWESNTNSVRQKRNWLSNRKPGDESLPVGYASSNGWRSVGNLALKRDHPHAHVIENAQASGDPTNTTTIRKQFAAKVSRRFRAVKGLIREAIIEKDVLGLREDAPDPRGEVTRTDYTDFAIQSDPLAENAEIPEDPDKLLNYWRGLVENIDPIARAAPRLKPQVFATDPNKADLFDQWLNDVNERVVLSKEDVGEERIRVTRGPEIEGGDPRWTDKWVRRSYTRGAKDADVKLRKAGANIPVQSEFGTVIRQPIHASTLESLFTRTFRELRNITDSVERDILRQFTDGLAEGIGPEQMARRANSVVGGIAPDPEAVAQAGKGGLHRGRLMARTEVIRAHSEATLNRFEQWGVDEVTGRAEWLTAGDQRVCPRCAGMEGTVQTTKAARGLIPLHPNCRCSWLPVVPEAMKRLDAEQFARARAGPFRAPQPDEIAQIVDTTTDVATGTGAAEGATPSPGDLDFRPKGIRQLEDDVTGFMKSQNDIGTSVNVKGWNHFRDLDDWIQNRTSDSPAYNSNGDIFIGPRIKDAERFLDDLQSQDGIDDLVFADVDDQGDIRTFLTDRDAFRKFRAFRTVVHEATHSLGGNTSPGYSFTAGKTMEEGMTDIIAKRMGARYLTRKFGDDIVKKLNQDVLDVFNAPNKEALVETFGQKAADDLFDIDDVREWIEDQLERTIGYEDQVSTIRGLKPLFAEDEDFVTTIQRIKAGTTEGSATRMSGVNLRGRRFAKEITEEWHELDEDDLNTLKDEFFFWDDVPDDVHEFRQRGENISGRKLIRRREEQFMDEMRRFFNFEENTDEVLEERDKMNRLLEALKDSSEEL